MRLIDCYPLPETLSFRAISSSYYGRKLTRGGLSAPW